MENNIEFADFSKSITTEEFIGVLEMVQAIYDNFERAVAKKDKRIAEEKLELEKMEEAIGKYDSSVRQKRKMYNLMDETLSQDIGKGYATFITNYDGIIEFLTRFSICGTINKIDVSKFKKKRDVKKTQTTLESKQGE